MSARIWRPGEDTAARRDVQIIWWVGLGGALVLTLVVLKQVALVLRALGDIHQLAMDTREAAEGIARNVAPISRLSALQGPVQGLDDATRTLAAAAGTIEQRLASLAPARSERKR